jgi:phage regulator Rha-like protein
MLHRKHKRNTEPRLRRDLIREDAIQRIYYQYDAQNQKKVVVEMKKPKFIMLVKSFMGSWVLPIVLSFIGIMAGLSLWKYVLKGGF